MSKKIITHSNGVVETREAFYTEETIQQLRHQLEQVENKTLKEFADKLDEEFGKNVEPTLSERADNIIALHRSNKKYCEMADEKMKELKQQLAEKDKEIERLIANESEALKYYSSTRTVYIRENRCKRCGKEISSILPDMFEGLCYECFEKFERGKFVPEQQLDEKDKEIEELKQNNKIFMQLIEETKSENIDDFAFLVRVTNGSYIQKLRKANRRVQELERLQTQLAIQELEKVKVNLKDRMSMMNNEEHSYLQKVVSWYDVCKQVNNQIKELKGE